LKILFLGYNKKETKLINFIESLGYQIEQTSEKVTNFKEWDLVISFGYRHIIKQEYLRTSKRPIINLHISYLPYNKGSHPNFWSFFENTPSGVTIHEIDKGIDTGKIIKQKYVNFKEKENTFSKTYRRLIKEIEKMFIKYSEKIITGNYIPYKQRGVGTHHNSRDLPKEMSNWNSKIEEVLNNINSTF
jgi:methionyl-tRNA formyltransferase